MLLLTRVIFSYVNNSTSYNISTVLSVFFWMFLSERLSTESLYTHGATTKDPSLHIPAAASIRDVMWLRFRADTILENGVSCSTSGHASNKVMLVLFLLLLLC